MRQWAPGYGLTEGPYIEKQQQGILLTTEN